MTKKEGAGERRRRKRAMRNKKMKIEQAEKRLRMRSWMWTRRMVEREKRKFMDEVREAGEVGGSAVWGPRSEASW